MREVVWVAFVLGAASYAAAGVLYLRRLLRHQASTAGVRAAPWLLAAGGLIHLGYIVADSAVLKRCPVYSLNSALGLVAIAAVFAGLVLGRGRRLDAMGASVAVSALILLLGSRILMVHPTGPVNRWLLAVHITSNLLGLGVLLLAGMASAFYLVQERRLKQKRLRSIGGKLPPLESLDEVVDRLLWVALPLLTIGIVSGMVVIRHAEVLTRADMVRAGFSYLSWFLVTGVWAMRQTRSWRGKRPAWVTLAGTGCILVVIGLYMVRNLWRGGS